MKLVHFFFIELKNEKKFELCAKHELLVSSARYQLSTLSCRPVLAAICVFSPLFFVAQIHTGYVQFTYLFSGQTHCVVGPLIDRSHSGEKKSDTRDERRR